MRFILSPEPSAELKAGSHKFSGVAFNDGDARLQSLLVSFDRGQSWRPADLQTPASPYAWYRWTIEAKLEPGTSEVWCRAVDAVGHRQPLNGTVYWNPNGYEWNGVHKIQLTVKR